MQLRLLKLVKKQVLVLSVYMVELEVKVILVKQIGI